MKLLRQPALLAALVFAVAAPVAIAQAPGYAATAAIHADHIRFVYPDSNEVSNDVFPPNEDRGAVRESLRSVMVLYRGKQMTLGQYIRALDLDPSKVVTVKVHGPNAAVYTGR